MTSRSVAQIAAASIRTSTSARLGTGTGLYVRVSCPGSPNTQAFMLSGIGKSLLVFTPAGVYMESSNAIVLNIAYCLPGTVEKYQFWLCSAARRKAVTTHRHCFAT